MVSIPSSPAVPTQPGPALALLGPVQGEGRDSGRVGVAQLGIPGGQLNPRRPRVLTDMPLLFSSSLERVLTWPGREDSRVQGGQHREARAIPIKQVFPPGLEKSGGGPAMLEDGSGRWERPAPQAPAGWSC